MSSSRDQDGDAERDQECRHHPPEHRLGDPSQQPLPGERAEEHAAAGRGHDGPDAQQIAADAERVDRHARAVDDQRDGHGGGDEDVLAHVEREHRRGADAALVTHQATQKPRQSARRPRAAPAPGARTPPGSPPGPPRTPDSPPAAHAPRRPMRRCSINPKMPRPPAMMRMAAMAIFSGPAATKACSSAPASAPTALISPKVSSTLLSMCRRSVHSRSALPMKCGMAAAATASRAPMASASSVVRMLPMPKPATAEVAPATKARTPTMTAKDVIAP